MAAGEILDGNQPPGTIGGESTARLIRQARFDKNIKAFVLRVDSPGGSVIASEQIYRELVAMRAAGKPVIVSMSTLAASGGYYISAPADEIWSSPATLTGSIGIFAIIPTIDKTLGKVGVTVDGVGTTPLAGQLRIDRPMTDDSARCCSHRSDVATTSSWRVYRRAGRRLASRSMPSRRAACGPGRTRSDWAWSTS